MKNNFQKILLPLSVILFVSLCFAFFFLYREINNNNQKNKKDMAIWQTEVSRRDSLRELNRSIQTISSSRELLQTHFAKSSDIVPFLDTIEKLAPRAGALAQVDSVDNLAGGAGLVVGVKASGSFEAVYKFLALLENSSYEMDFLLVDIHKLTTPGTQKENIKDSKWEAVFKIQLLSFIP